MPEAGELNQKARVEELGAASVTATVTAVRHESRPGERVRA